MRPEPVPRITSEEMFKIWPDIWRDQDQDPSTIELDAVDTKHLPCGYGAVATAAAVEVLDDEPVVQKAQSYRSKARHALRHFELGPFKIHRAVLPLAAVATGVAVAYLGPHSNTPAIAEKKPGASSLPHSSHTTSPKKQTKPNASPTDVPFTISGYERSPSASHSWRYDGGTESLSPQPSASESHGNNSGPKPRNSTTSAQPRPTESVPPTHETPTQAPKPSDDPTTAGPTPPAVPQATETSSQSDTGQTAPGSVAPPRTLQSNTSVLQATETPTANASTPAEVKSTGSSPSSS